jgi:hypothetical protein
MLSRMIVIGAAAALALSAPAMAKGPHGGGGMKGHGGMSMGSLHGRGGDEWRMNRQGPSHASARAHERANANAGLNDDMSVSSSTRFSEHAGYNYGRTHRDVARAKHRQGPMHASARAKARANANADLNPQD